MSGRQLVDLVLDSSAIIALVSSWHTRHNSVHELLEGHSRQGDRIAVAGHALIEAYSVLTRLPAPYRLAPIDAHELLETNFATSPILTLSKREYWRLLQDCATQGVGGGRVYDASIARAARSGRNPTLVTLNPKHFEQFAGSSLRIMPVSPGRETEPRR